MPILFLPSRDRNPGIPDGWVEVTADAETYQANVREDHRERHDAWVIGHERAAGPHAQVVRA